MRVVATRDFRTYYRMESVRVRKGQEFDGEFADYLHTSRCPVDVLEGSADPGAGQSAGGELDIDGTVEAVLAWVGDDPGRAGEALAAESAKDKPRSTLTKRLEEIAAA